MNSDKTKKVSVFSILIFVLCGILLIYTVWSAISVTSYIGEMIEYGSIKASESIFDIISYYMTNCGMYVVYIAILLSIWWIKPKMQGKGVKEVIEYEEITEKKDASGTETTTKKEVITEIEKDVDKEDYVPEAENLVKDQMNIPLDDENDKTK